MGRGEIAASLVSLAPRNDGLEGVSTASLRAPNNVRGVAISCCPTATDINLGKGLVMDELKIIEHIRKIAGKNKAGVKLGIGDDCAVLNFNQKEYLLWASDMIVEDKHFSKKTDTYKEIGHKAVAVNVSDIASMGGTPRFITVSMGVPEKLSQKCIKEIFVGINAICKKYGVQIVGGDTVESEKLVIDVSVIGTVKKKELVTRSGAKCDDMILITGPVRNGKRSHLKFEPRIKEANQLVAGYKINAMIDTSDGIFRSLEHICAESGVGYDLHIDRIPLVSGLDVKDALYYGESFELLFTMNKSQAKKLLSVAANNKKFFCVGNITSKKDGRVVYEH